MMNKQEILSQLRDLGWHCESMADPFEKDNIWLRDIEALHKATEYVDKYMRDDDVERQPKTGHWIEDLDSVMPFWKCSRCNKFEDKKTRFCPRCGAEMTEEAEETKEAENED